MNRRRDRRSPRDAKIKTASDQLVCFVAGRLAEGMSCPQIAERARQRFRLEWLTREQVYSLFAEAVRRGLMVICPPKDVYLGHRLLDRLETDAAVVGRRTQVVCSDEVESVAMVMAEVLAAQIDAIRTESEPSVVHLGLGSGQLVRLAIKQLAKLLRAKPTLPIHFVLHPLVTNRSEFPPLACLGYLDSGGPTAEIAAQANDIRAVDVVGLEIGQDLGEELLSERLAPIRECEATIVLGANGPDPAMLWKLVTSWPWHDLVLSHTDAQALLEHLGPGSAGGVGSVGP